LALSALSALRPLGRSLECVRVAEFMPSFGG